MDPVPEPHISPRRHKHHRRLSALRLSTDTTASLPAYSAPPRPPSASKWPLDIDPPTDEPPDYPQSAEEADREDDFTPLPPRSAIRRSRHRRTESLSSSLQTSTSVDDLLERSVVALELSTSALLQSMNTQSSISVIANDNLLERSLERQALLLDMRLRGNRDTHQGWMDDLDDVMKRVDSLFPEIPKSELDGAVSRSLPTESLPLPRPRKVKQAGISADQPYLHLTTSSEIDLRESVRPPRALTQYVSVESSCGEVAEATAGSDSILLPSTMGLRSRAQVRPLTSIGTHPPLRKALSSPGPERSPSASTPAISMLSELVSRQSSSRSPSRTRTATPHQSPCRSDSRIKSGRRYSAGSADSSTTPGSSIRRTRPPSRCSSSTSTETLPPPPVRAMTPPMEESTPSSSESEQNEQAFRAMQSLRRILDDAPDPKGKHPKTPEKPLKPGFLPRSPAVAPSSGTSMATASVYRLFTKSSHHPSSARQKSSLKKPPPPDGLAHPSTPGSQISSAPSTPRTVSFADLPEEFPGRSWRDKDKGRRSKGKSKKAKEKEREESGWWKWIASPPNGHHNNAGAYEDRMEDKMMRGWRPAASNGPADDWML